MARIYYKIGLQEYLPIFPYRRDKPTCLNKKWAQKTNATNAAKYVYVQNKTTKSMQQKKHIYNL